MDKYVLVTKKIKNIILNQTNVYRFKCSNIDIKYKLKDDLNLDSLDNLEILLNIEEEFEIIINDKDWIDIINKNSITIQDLIDFVYCRVK